MNQQFLTELKAVTAENRIFTDEPMKKHTTFRVGGPADVLIQPKRAELASVIRLCREYDIPYQVIGNGSNLLVGDRGIRGAVIEMLSKKMRFVWKMTASLWEQECCCQRQQTVRQSMV